MFRFTIRDLLWLMVVIALILSWRVDRNNLWRLLHTEVNIGVSLTIDGPGCLHLSDQNQEFFRSDKFPDVPPRLVFAKSAWVTANKFNQLVVQCADAEFLLEPVIHIPHREPFTIDPDGQVFYQCGKDRCSAGQLAIATFAHEDKLQRIWRGSDFFLATDESGPPKWASPGENGTGLLRRIN